MTENHIYVHYVNSHPFTEIKRVYLDGLEIPVLKVTLVQSGSDLPVLNLEIPATAFDLVEDIEQVEEELAENSIGEQPENDDF